MIHSKFEQDRYSQPRDFVTLLLGSAKVNKDKNIAGTCYIIKRVLTFVSSVQESVLVDFISQNFA